MPPSPMRIRRRTLVQGDKIYSGKMEVFHKPIWVRQAYTSGATVLLDFFNTVATQANGNWPSTQLEDGHSFDIWSIQVAIELPTREHAPVAAAAGVVQGPFEDMFQFIHTGWAELKIGTKDYGEWPLFKLPQGGGVGGALQVTAAQAAGNVQAHSLAVNGSSDPRQVMYLRRAIQIPSLTNVRLRLQWPAFVTTDGGINPQIKVILDGLYYRPQ